MFQLSDDPLLTHWHTTQIISVSFTSMTIWGFCIIKATTLFKLLCEYMLCGMWVLAKELSKVSPGHVMSIVCGLKEIT